jgi:hypothetical protein
VLDVLLHELIHHAVGTECGHKGAFKKAAEGVGLVGKMTATEAGPELLVRLNALAEELGTPGHGKLQPGEKITKQSTRLLKAACPECGYTVRVTRKWVDGAGTPLCPCNPEEPLAMVVDGEEGKE